MARLNSAGVTSITRAKTVVIALFTQTSIGPSSFSIRAAACFHLVGICHIRGDRQALAA